MLDDLVDSPSAAGLSLARGDYAELFHAALGDRVVRRPETRDVRISILGRLEARLLSFDRVVLGGLNEDTWPPELRNDPWLSPAHTPRPRPRSARALHQPCLPRFRAGLGAPEVILARAAKVAGTPTVASRFVQRIAALSGEDRWKSVLERGNEYLALARALDAPAEVKPTKQPKPNPPRDVRPNKLSVTEIEHWLRDPYTIYAKHVLRLFPPRCRRYATGRSRSRHRHT